MLGYAHHQAPGPQPVSYTHLDVYKRQILFFIIIYLSSYHLRPWALQHWHSFSISDLFLKYKNKKFFHQIIVHYRVIEIKFIYIYCAPSNLNFLSKWDKGWDSLFHYKLNTIAVSYTHLHCI